MESLGIDVKLLIAQIFNFLAVLFLLKKFLYKPLLKHLDERRRRVQEGEANAKKIEERLAQVEVKQKEIFKKARNEAKKERELVRQQTEKEKEEIIQKARQAAQNELEKGLARIKDEEEALQKRLKESLTKDLIEKAETQILKDLKKSGAQKDLIKRVLSKNG